MDKNAFINQQVKVLLLFSAWICGVFSGLCVDDIILGRDSVLNFCTALFLMNMIAIFVYKQNKEITEKETP